MKNFYLIFFLLFSNFFVSQELNCEVVVEARQTGNENLQVFKTLQTQLTEFINNTSWTNKAVRQNEKIDCTMFINISSYENDVFQGTLQIQSSRPIFNSSYNSPTYNFNDRNFTFNYQEFQNFTFNENQFENNLVSVIAFHIYVILGIDADTFKLNSGTSFFEQAQKGVTHMKPPHPYGCGARSYNRMMGRKKNQSVIVCGESGAGKVNSNNFL